MSKQHWIDEFFRKRLEHRDFPVEKGEYEEMRTLLQERNSTVDGVRGADFSKWWFSALLPLAGLLWWAVGGNVDRPEDRFSQTTEDRRTAGPNGAEQHAPGTGNSIPSAALAPSFVPVEAGSPVPEVPATRVRAQATPVNNAGTAAAPGSDKRSIPAAGTPRAVSNDVMAAKDQGSLNSRGEKAGRTSQSGQVDVRSEQEGLHTPVDARDGTPRSDGNDVRPDRGGSDAGVDNGEGKLQLVDAIPIPHQAGTPSEEVGPNPVNSMGSAELLSARSEVDAVTIMQPRWPIPPLPDRPEPSQRDAEAVKPLHMGELHVFGAPLAVRTRSGSGERSGEEAGSLFGLEYRVRIKHFAWATGIHYGSYTLKADQGATDVKLNFVEVPLLASVHLNRGRWGVSMQGGLSVDLLFNSRGSYRVEGDHSGGAFPDGAFQTVNCSWLLRPQASYHVADHLSVSAGPLWKAQLGEVANAGSLNGAHVSSSGIAIGITWRLERSTF